MDTFKENVINRSRVITFIQSFDFLG